MAFNEELLKTLRTAELLPLRRVFQPGLRVLEIGGGNGWQAALLSSWGCKVTSIDVDPVSDWTATYFPVMQYDGRHIPFEDRSFDVVFSSNVLEHVPHVYDLLIEMRRVLVPDGLAIHILPTPVWRFWTSMSHYLHVAQKGISILRRRTTPGTAAGSDATRTRKTATYYLRKVTSAGPHGVSSSAARELIDFSRRRWARELERAGYELAGTFPAGLFYTGFGVFPMLSIDMRQRLAKFLGSACRVFIARPAPAKQAVGGTDKLPSCYPDGRFG